MKKYMFALMSFAALAAYAVTPATKWGDVSPTNTLTDAMAATVTNLTRYADGTLDAGTRLNPERNPRGYGSFVAGTDGIASGRYALAMGFYCFARTNYCQAVGWCAEATNEFSWVWNGVRERDYYGNSYKSHGLGTYNINPVGGLSGFWIGETNLADHLNERVSTNALAGQSYNLSTDEGITNALAEIIRVLGGTVQ